MEFGLNGPVDRLSGVHGEGLPGRLASSSPGAVS
jgi:hypothetical protein